MRRRSTEQLASEPARLYVEQRGRPTLQPATPEQVEEIYRLRSAGYARVVVGPNRRARRAARRAT